MEWVTIVTMLALVELAVFGLRTGMARSRYEIKAPATTGHEIFERHYRVHYNTIEHVILFIPALWAFAYYISPYWAAGIGAVFLVGRIIYGVSYVKDPASRGPGMGLSILPCWVLILGGLIGAVMQLVHSVH
ncbi:MAG TPA: MAPEG family protein [Pseudomonadales bacterium]|nr:MAPEG family protein [Pseudomonadales bacterium]